MKNKFLALAAFCTAILGGAILSAPASAQIPRANAATNTINVNVSVPEILFLRTLQNASVVIAPGDFLTGAGGLTTPVPGSDPLAYVDTDQTSGPAPATTLNTLSPFDVTGASINVPITDAYIVWSNSPTGTYEVDITPTTPFDDANGNNLAITVDPGSIGQKTAQGLTGTAAEPINLIIPVSTGAKAGNYAGVLTVEAWRP